MWEMDPRGSLGLRRDPQGHTIFMVKLKSHEDENHFLMKRALRMGPGRGTCGDMVTPCRT